MRMVNKRFLKSPVGHRRGFFNLATGYHLANGYRVKS
jgi:hypothetical protein